MAEPDTPPTPAPSAPLTPPTESIRIASRAPDLSITVDAGMARTYAGGPTLATEAVSRPPATAAPPAPSSVPAAPLPIGPEPRVDPNEGSPVTSAILATSAAIGKRLGPYILKRELGRGGMGVVYLAEHAVLKREVALKIMLSAEFASERERHRFSREAEAAAGLRHPNIVAVHDIGEEGGRTYFTMDAVAGITLKEWIRHQRPTMARAIAVMAKVCDAVGYAHSRGIIHRDLKPMNVLVDSADEPHIMDFGLAKRLSPGEDTNFTIDGAVIGTPHYMSPEQASGKVDQVDVRCDVYSLGVMLYELATGDLPFRAEALSEMVRLILHAEPLPVRKRNPEAGKDLELIIAKAMAKEPERRYWTAYALRADLDHYLRREPVNARRASVLYRTRKWIERHRILSGTALALFLVGAALSSYSRYKSGKLVEALLVESARGYEEAVAARADYDARVEKRGGFSDAGAREALQRDGVNRLERALVTLGHAQNAGGPRLLALEVQRRIGQAQQASAEFTRIINEAHKFEVLHAGRAVRIDEAQKAIAETRRQLEDALGEDEDENLWGRLATAYEILLAAVPEDVEVRRRMLEAKTSQVRVELFLGNDRAAEWIVGGIRRHDPALAKELGMEIAARRRRAEVVNQLLLFAERQSDWLARQRAYAAILELDPTNKRALLGHGLAGAQLLCAAGSHEAELEALRRAALHVEDPRDVGDLDRAQERAAGELVAELQATAQVRIAAREYGRALECYRRARKVEPRLLPLDVVETLRERDQDVRLLATLPPELIFVSGDRFPYGPERRERQVRSFVIGRAEVSNAEFERFVAAGGYVGEASLPLWDHEARELRAQLDSEDGAPGPLGWQQGKPPDGAGALPVTGVSWYEARAYTRWLGIGFRLPYEDEWEVAASWDPRARRKIDAPWLEPAGAETAGWDEAWARLFNLSAPRPADADQPFWEEGTGRRCRDLSPLGCRGMYANVTEWCNSAVARDITAVRPGAEPPDEPVLRGGSFRARYAERVGPTWRGLGRPTVRQPHIGFRVAKDLR